MSRRVRPTAQLHTNSAPKRTRVPSMQASAPSIDQAGLAASGTEVASNSRASQGWSGRSLGGQHPPSPSPRLPQRIPLQSQSKAAAAIRRTRRTVLSWAEMAIPATRQPMGTATTTTTTTTSTSKCRALFLAPSPPSRQHPHLHLHPSQLRQHKLLSDLTTGWLINT